MQDLNSVPMSEYLIKHQKTSVYYQSLFLFTKLFVIQLKT